MTATQRFSYLVTTAYNAGAPAVTGTEFNFGINGQGLNYVYSVAPSDHYGTLIADAVLRVNPLLQYSGPKYLVFFGATNDIFLNGTTGSGAWTLMSTYIDQEIAAGFTPGNICVGTMLPRQGQHETDRTTLNGLIRTNAPGKGVKICDFAANGSIGCAGCEDNTSFFLDRIHPAAAGHVIMADIIKATFGF